MPKTNAIITASFHRDFERCALLCESIDRHARGHEAHYILVDGPDVALFRRLEGPRRKIIGERDILPWWMVRIPDPRAPARRLWVSPFTQPLNGWQVQQIMRIAIAHKLAVDGLLYCDSDTAMIRPFDLAEIWDGDTIRMFREDEGVSTAADDHAVWHSHARKALGLEGGVAGGHNYVCSFVTWKRQTVIDMCHHMQTTHRRNWVAVVGRSRRFSECMLYGTYVDAVIGGEGHAPHGESLCPMQWFEPAPTEAELLAFVDALDPAAAGFGVQSFIPVPLDSFRRAAGLAA